MSTDTPAKTQSNLPYKPEDDGVTHINVYTRGATTLGRGLSNLSECNIEHPYFGHFRTLEGLWFYMKTDFKDDQFRILKGIAARDLGKSMPTEPYPLFNKMFKLGMLVKLERNPSLIQELINNDKPLAHYYSYGGGKKIVQLDRHQWQLDFWILLRSTLINTGSLDVIRNELEESIKYHLANPKSPKVDE
jgi:hypothetical protein